MRRFDREFSRLAQEESVRKRVAPFLSEPFDAVVLERPSFCAEIGLEKEDEALLRPGATGQYWLTTAAFWRGLAEELRERKEKPEGFLGDFPALDEKQQWVVVQRIFMRMDQLVNLTKERKKVATQLQVPMSDLDAWHKRWKDSMAQEDQAVTQALQLRLLGIGLPPQKELLAHLEKQSRSTFLWFFHFARPILTKVEDPDIEITVIVPSPLGNGQEYAVRESLAKEMEENSHLSPQLWSKQWVDYLAKHKNLSNPEFRYLLDHLEQGGRHRWPDMVAGQGARARRAVSGVAVGILEGLAGPDDPEAIQRLFSLIENFSEHHEMKTVLKKRFGV